jgi:hypothetical protein
MLNTIILQSQKITSPGVDKLVAALGPLLYIVAVGICLFCIATSMLSKRFNRIPFEIFICGLFCYIVYNPKILYSVGEVSGKIVFYVLNLVSNSVTAGGE